MAINIYIQYVLYKLLVESKYYLYALILFCVGFGAGPSHDAGRQQDGRGGDAGGPDGGRGVDRREVELQLHGDVRKDEQQREGDVPGAAEHGEVEERRTPPGEEGNVQEGEAEGQMQDHVNTFPCK